MNPLLISKGHKPRKGVVKICPICNVQFYKSQSGKNRIFCSKKCADKNLLTGKEYKCETCGKMSYRNNGQIKHRGMARFCSKKCKGQDWKNIMKSQGWKPQKRMLKSSAILKKKLWKVFAKWIKERDNYICFTCNSKVQGGNAHAGHFIPKSVGGLSLYFHEDNVHCQCARCNIWMSGNQYIFGQKLGETKVKELYTLKQKSVKWSELDYEKRINHYTRLTL